MKSIEISIVVPVYNGSRYLRETLHSLLSQTIAEFELIVIDDGSTDGSSEAVRSLNDDRIRLIQTKNAGLAQALNCGIAEARASYIARSDQDDISFPSRLERELQVLRDNPDASGVFAYITKFGRKQSWANLDKVRISPGRVKIFEPTKDGCMVGSTMLMRTSALQASGGFRQEYYPADDWDLELRLAQAGKLLVICEPLVAYRFHASANTYRVFADMREKSRWAEDSYLRRQASTPELTFEQYRRTAARNIWTQLRHFRKDSSALHMRIAGQKYLDGSYIAGACHLLASIILRPSAFVMRIRHLIGRA